MTQGLLHAQISNRVIASHQQHLDRSLSRSRQHARPHAYASCSIKLTSQRSSFAGQRLIASHSRSTRPASRYAVHQAVCQAAANKLIIAVTGVQARLLLRLHLSFSLCRFSCLCTATGATGLVGSRLVSRLAAQGHTVRVLSRNTDKARSKLPYARLQFFNVQRQLSEALKGANGVINLAGTAQLHLGHPCSDLCLFCNSGGALVACNDMCLITIHFTTKP